MGESTAQGRLAPRFLVDNDLSPLIAQVLRLFEYPISTVVEVFGSGDIIDPDIIDWLGETGAIWITHDKAAKRRHRIQLVTNRVTVLWIRGERLSNWDQTMIVLRVWKVMVEKAQASRGAIHFRAGRQGGPTPAIDWAERPEDRPREHVR